jgi:glycosyltransferase involved in cell wall biosynthesis
VANPVLSLAVPTRNRPELLERALRSLGPAMGSVAEYVEVAVSDGSDADTSGRVVERLLGDWPGGHRYVRNRPALTLVENMNRAAELATGEWVQQLDDDDLMLPGCGRPMIDGLRRAAPEEKVMIFGAHIVDAAGVKQREQVFVREQYLPPEEALRRLLRSSSFVREPMVVVRQAAIVEVGLFELGVGDATDTDMWVKLFSRHGARCLPVTTCAYTIHEAAATTGMWNPRTIEALGTVFDRAVASGVVPEREVRRWETDFFHQFILAGAYRRLRVRRRAEARDVLRLFRLPMVRALGPSPKWLPVRLAFTTAAAIPLWAASGGPAQPETVAR